MGVDSPEGVTGKTGNIWPLLIVRVLRTWQIMATACRPTLTIFVFLSE